MSAHGLTRAVTSFNLTASRKRARPSVFDRGAVETGLVSIAHACGSRLNDLNANRELISKNVPTEAHQWQVSRGTSCGKVPKLVVTTWPG